VETKEQAQKLIEHCYFAPEGLRSYTSKRVTRFGTEKDLSRMMAQANEDLMIIPQIESITAYQNLDEILDVEGIDVLAGGPNDLAQSMGFPGQPDHPDCLKVTAEGRVKITNAGKYRDDEVMVSIDATIAVKESIENMLSNRQ
jgi:2-keto-3-deoxy-L-rhamnonate aldolase RhmA